MLHIALLQGITRKTLPKTCTQSFPPRLPFKQAGFLLFIRRLEVLERDRGLLDRCRHLAA